MTTNEIELPRLLLPPAALPVRASGLLFVNEQLLFVEQNENGGWSSKFVTAQDARAAFSSAEQDSGWLPAGVVRVGSNAAGPWCVYSAPAQRVDVLLEGDEQGFSLPIPRTVLLGAGDGYHLWSLKTTHFDPYAVTCSAPFPNVYDDGKICWGSNTPGLVDPGKMRQVWELFFSTPFNGHLIQNKSRTHKDDIRTVLRAMAEQKAKKYPLDDLAGTQQPVGQLINRILGVK